MEWRYYYYIMSESRKFDPAKLAKLNDPKRLEILNPELIWTKADLKDPDILVDIGAGTGFFALPFSRKVRKGKVYACDISEEMISWMKNNLPPESQGVVIPLKMEESSVPLPDGIADLVYMINLHHELEDPVAAIKEALRLLKSGGKLIIIDWKKEETPNGPPLTIRLTEETIESQMLACGFTNIRKHAVLPYHSFLVGGKISK
jgi:ubiquinone/menaquinone biosynthesis C-methylase UbiE